jgi:hypothetical protein
MDSGARQWGKFIKHPTRISPEVEAKREGRISLKPSTGCFDR